MKLYLIIRWETSCKTSNVQENWYINRRTAILKWTLTKRNWLRRLVKTETSLEYDLVWYIVNSYYTMLFQRHWYIIFLNFCISGNEIEEALQQMMSMGFHNEGGWLLRLLQEKDGHIEEVLENILIEETPQRKHKLFKA